jgi:glycosyltransferase involved in cell wall biosynthesis
MRILILHNRYQQPGGEDAVVRLETALLRDHGHDVDLVEEDNNNIVSRIEGIKTALRCVYSRQAFDSTARRIQQFHPDVVHVHNFFPRLSPAVHYASVKAGVPVVQTLHNFRLLCPPAIMYRAGKVCEECVGKTFAWPAVKHGCYRGRVASLAVANMSFAHRAAGTWNKRVSVFVALTEFARGKFASAGVPEEKIVVKPNFVTDSDLDIGNGSGGFVLFVGRLSDEKGIQVLLDAWRKLKRKPALKIIGDGPLRPLVQSAAKEIEEIEWLGTRENSYTLNLMRQATVLVLPSSCYEGFPLVAAEAMSAGLPVIGSGHGSIAEIIAHGETGRLFTPGDPSALAEQIDWVFHHPCELSVMRERARQEYERKYSADRNHSMLMDIYQLAISSNSR